MNVPKYDEFKAEEVWKQIKDDDKISIYFKGYSNKGYPDRTYMYNVIINRIFRDLESF